MSLKPVLNIKIKLIQSIRLLLFFFVVLFFLNRAVAATDRETPDFEQFKYPIYLYQNNEFYRSITEILRLKFNYPELTVKYGLDSYLLKSYYQSKEYPQLIKKAETILKNPSRFHKTEELNNIRRLLSLTFIHAGNEQRAKKNWMLCCFQNNESLFPESNTTPGLISPDKARIYSTILPGSGLLLSGEYRKAAVSFLLNTLFLAGIYQSYSQDQYGIAGLLFFFEIGWYMGGRNASYEAAIDYNSELIKRYQKNWIDAQQQILFGSR